MVIVTLKGSIAGWQQGKRGGRGASYEGSRVLQRGGQSHKVLVPIMESTVSSVTEGTMIVKKLVHGKG